MTLPEDAPAESRSPLLAAAEALLNRLLALDPDSPPRLAPLQGRRLRVELSEPELRFDLWFDADGVRVQPPGDSLRADARFAAAVPALAGLALSGGTAPARVTLEGDVTMVQQVRNLFQGLDPDWEDLLSRFLGDVAAHRLGEAARGLDRYGRETADTLLRNLGEYLTEERRELPAAAEVAAFVDDVDRLREDMDRLAARLARLERDAG